MQAPALKKNKIKVSTSEKIVHVFIVLFLTLFTLLCLLPFLNVLGSSFATSAEISTRTFILIPRTFTLNAYRYILSTPTIFKSIGVSLYVTIFGTFISMVLTSFMAYALSRRYLHGRSFFNFLVVFTMLFSGGMIPAFILVKNLGLIDTLWALILPSAVSAYNMIIMRNFFQGIPDSLEESAKMDGCSDWGVFFKIILPLSLPSIATISLFYAVTYWNTYQSAILYINDSNKWPIQVLLRQIVIVSSGLNADAASVDVVPPAQSIKMAVIVVATIPMLIAYPFVQKYFVKGAMVGSVKG
ncbi:carbohydrate ABC transporter permease [Enterococcus lemanii]|jgi:putative aldouronate transport system permease protein|uniref:Carbohydrate ABC transporter permease n=1 Tax=Enterococcus lemanii TaxID=1159752 RepID=A0ABV9MTN3_9ENTE|nr:carbohydrate ABC transporter permease [Enterococcus lemanii]MBM7709587.1 putative aldouronate transport system permease protein [Enterococcus lemanii]NLM65743.1 carbohydrate ABC transporter permease [Enterococcus sp.]